MMAPSGFMPIRFRGFRFLAALALLACAWALPKPVRAGAGPTPMQIDAIFSPLISQRGPGLAVLVRKDGRITFERGYGRRDLRSGEPIDAHTNFRLASCTKQFTAVAVLLLAHDGKLHLDDPL